MKFDENDGVDFDALKRLPYLTPDPGWSESVRMRCRTQLGRRPRRRTRPVLIMTLARRVIAPVVVVGFCVLYIAALAATALRLNGALR
jgi:hypothetical protein